MTVPPNLTILCHAATPADQGGLEQWLTDQLDEIRSLAPPGALVQLFRLTQGLPDSEIENGWLIEIQAPSEWSEVDREPMERALSAILVDMRLLGLQPQTLSVHDPATATAGAFQ